jgi:halimadienyl-diphosphate synthase
MLTITEIIQGMGAGHMNNTAYDTSWIARLQDIDDKLSLDALQWICENQLPDGSWGAPKVMYYHDRIISTLSAMLALIRRGRRASDKWQIEKGLIALEKVTAGATRGLAADPNGATVGFELIVPTLIHEAEELGIIKKQGDRILGRMKALRERKLQKLVGLKISRHLTPAFSIEMTGHDRHELIDTENLQEVNGSVANSPSATAFFVSQVKIGDERGMKYLHWAIDGRGGGAPFATPFNVFERSWILWNIALVPSLVNDPQIRAECAPHITFLQDSWRPGCGVGFANVYTPCDGDDTSVLAEALARFGVLMDVETILSYEGADYFRCYHLEANPSVGANVHMLGALGQYEFEADHPSVQKIVQFLRNSRHKDGYLVDKWHISPYYITAHMVIAAMKFDRYLCQDAIDWILRTQNRDGSWGSFGFSTAEETAYCIQALILWKRFGGKVPEQQIPQAVSWLERHANGPYPPLWISKALYCPELVVQSCIVTALALAKE